MRQKMSYLTSKATENSSIQAWDSCLALRLKVC